MTRPAAVLTESPGRRAVLITADRIRYSDGTVTLWRPSGPVTFRARPHDPDRRARWIAHATGSGIRLRRADVQPSPGWSPIASFRAAAGDIGGTPSAEAMRRFRSLEITPC